MQLTRIILFVITLSLYIFPINGRGVWKKKRPREQENEVGVTGELALPKSSTLKKNASPLSANYLSEMLDQYFNQFNIFVDSPEFIEYFTPDLIKSLVESFEAVEDISSLMDKELYQAITSLKFQSPISLKATVKRGMKLIQENIVGFKDMLNDPEKLLASMDGISDELKPFLLQAMNGDMSGLKSIIPFIPNLTPENTELLEHILDGNIADAAKSLKKAFGNKDIIEETRLNLLKNSELVEALGIDVDIVNDPIKWGEYASEAFNEISKAIDEFEKAGGKDVKSKLFSGARAL